MSEGLRAVKNDADVRAINSGLHAFSHLIHRFDMLHDSGISLRSRHAQENIESGYFSYVMVPDDDSRAAPAVRTCVMDYSPLSEGFREVILDNIDTRPGSLLRGEVAALLAGLEATYYAARDSLVGTVIPESAVETVNLVSRFLIYQGTELFTNRGDPEVNKGDLWAGSTSTALLTLLGEHSDANVGALLSPTGAGGYIASRDEVIQPNHDEAVFLRGQLYSDWMQKYAEAEEASLSVESDPHEVGYYSGEPVFSDGPFLLGTTTGPVSTLLVRPPVRYRGSALTFVEPSSISGLPSPEEDLSGEIIIFNQKNPYLSSNFAPKRAA